MASDCGVRLEQVQTVLEEQPLREFSAGVFAVTLRCQLKNSQRGIQLSEIDLQLQVSKNVKVANIENAASLITVVFEEFQFSLDDFLTLHNLVGCFPD